MVKHSMLTIAKLNLNYLKRRTRTNDRDAIIVIIVISKPESSYLMIGVVLAVRHRSS